MATFKVDVIKRQKEDKTFRVRIRVIHQRKPDYITTEHYVTKSQLDRKFNIKDNELTLTLVNTIEKYRKKADKLSTTINQYSVSQLIAYLEREEVRNVDYITWSTSFVNAIKIDGTRKNGWTTLNSFIDFVGSSIDINEISLVTIKKYEDYLRSERKGWRVTNIGKPPTLLTFKPVTDTGVKDYMTKLKNWYVEAMKHYNDRGNIIVPYNPFDKYETPDAVVTDDKDLTVEQIIQLRDCGKVEVGKYKRTATTQLAKDIAMLSFYLVGINAVDLYYVDTFKDGRISYDRAKTASRRTDNAHISIKVEPEALPIIEKYLDPTGERVFKFHLMYTHFDGLTNALNRGLKEIAKHLKWKNKVTFIWLRYSWGNIARNDCGVPKDDVGEALNHSDNEHKVTDIYLTKIWVRIDNANRKVLDYLATVTLLQVKKVPKAVA
jgi:hypothetical protein